MEDTAKIEEFFEKHFPAFLEEREEIAREEAKNTIIQLFNKGKKSIRRVKLQSRLKKC